MRDFTAETGAGVFVGDAVQQLQFGRIAKVPEGAKPDQRAGRRPRQPQSEALRGKERQTLADNVVGLLLRDDLVVEDEPSNARLREDRVECLAIVVRNRAENQASGVERGYFFRTRSITTS